MKMIHVVFVISLASLTALVILGATSATASMAAPQTTFSVTSTADAVDNNLGDNQCHAALPGNPCTLRAAIQQADALDGGSTIMLPAGTYTLTIAGTGEDAAATGDLDVLHTLTLQGAGATATIINADGIDRVFDITPTAQLTISGVTIENGRDNGYTGGGILNRGSLTLIDDVVYHNHTTTSGGGIASIGVLILSNTHIISNSSYFYGGGIESGGPLHITGGSLVSNTTDYGGGGLDAGNVVVLENAHVAGNQATGLAASGSGGGIQFDGTSLQLTNVTLSGNQAVVDGGGLSARGSTDLSRVQVLNNVASNGFNDGVGGGLHFEGGWPITLTDVTITGNLGFGIAGGIMIEAPTTLNRVTLSDNRAGEFGGALFISTTTTARLINSTISGNSLDAGAGGGIYNIGVLSLTNVTIVSNTAPAFGSAIYGGGGVQARDTIIAKAYGSPVHACDGGSIQSDGHNLDNDGSCGLTAAGDLSDTNPLLGPLADNSGRTRTHALLPGSPAIDAGDNNSCPSVDQRYLPRPFDGNGDGQAVCDIGAYEYGSAWLIYLPLALRNAP